jgi:hypothetical protein
MPSLLSGSTLRKGGSNTYINLSEAQPQLPATPTTSTGYTLVTTDKLVTSYRSSLGNIEFNLGEMYSNLPSQNIKLIGTDSTFVVVAGGVANTGTNTGALVVQGGVGIADGLWTGKDIHVNGLTIGQGYEGLNNIVIKGTAQPQVSDDDNGQQSIVIGYDALQGLNTSNKAIAIGRYALSSGTSLSRTIAIGDSALKNIGVYHRLPYADITSVSLTNPVQIEAAGHDLTSGTYITIAGVEGTVELNETSYYVWVVSSSTINLYSDVNLNIPVDGTGFTAYASSGTVYLNTVYDENIAIGTEAGESLINGRQNFFFGDRIARNFTTGSYNLFMGHEVANNMITGNGNIAIGGDNLVDGLDNQINIGSTFYYNGQGYTQINSDLGVGLGIESTGTDTGALVVYGGVGISGQLNTNGLVTVNNGMIVQYLITGTITTATNLAGGSVGGIPYQSSTGTTNFIEIGALNTVLVSDGTTATWTTLSAIAAGTATDAVNIFVNDVVPETTYYLGLTEITGDFSPIDSDTALSYVTTTATTSSYFITGTSVLNVPGSIYSNDGNSYEANLLYTPRVTVSTTAPENPRIGDFWIDPTYGVELQYIDDGGNKFWIQFTGL